MCPWDIQYWSIGSTILSSHSPMGYYQTPVGLNTCPWPEINLPVILPWAITIFPWTKYHVPMDKYHFPMGKCTSSLGTLVTVHGLTECTPWDSIICPGAHKLVHGPTNIYVQQSQGLCITAHWTHNAGHGLIHTIGLWDRFEALWGCSHVHGLIILHRFPSHGQSPIHPWETIQCP